MGPRTIRYHKVASGDGVTPIATDLCAGWLVLLSLGNDLVGDTGTLNDR
jgi:hypothetical protein